MHFKTDEQKIVHPFWSDGRIRPDGHSDGRTLGPTDIRTDGTTSFTPPIVIRPSNTLNVHWSVLLYNVLHNSSLPGHYYEIMNYVPWSFFPNRPLMHNPSFFDIPPFLQLNSLFPPVLHIIIQFSLPALLFNPSFPLPVLYIQFQTSLPVLYMFIVQPFILLHHSFSLLLHCSLPVLYIYNLTFFPTCPFLQPFILPYPSFKCKTLAHTS